MGRLAEYRPEVAGRYSAKRLHLRQILSWHAVNTSRSIRRPQAFRAFCVTAPGLPFSLAWPGQPLDRFPLSPSPGSRDLLRHMTPMCLVPAGDSHGSSCSEYDLMSLDAGKDRSGLMWNGQ
jgi:hypothetical protein